MKFIDTNVFVYVADSKNPAKRAVARKLITTAVSSGDCRINVQVLNEFTSVAHRKLGLATEEIKAYLELFRALPVFPMSADVTEKGIDVMNRYEIQFYDALLLVSASEAGVTNLSPKTSMTGRLTAG